MIYYEFGPFRLDPVKRVLLRNGERVAIPAKPFDLLLALVERGGELASKEILMKQVWGELKVSDNTFNVTINTIRKTLGETARDHQYVVTTPEGYRFVAPIRVIKRDETSVVTGGVQRPAGSVERQASEPVAAKEGHIWYIVTACMMYSSLYVIALFVEIAYQWDRYGETALKICPLIFLWILITSTFGLTLDWKRARQGQSGGMALCWLVFLLAVILLFGSLLLFLPAVPITQAEFPTHTAQAAYIKEICYFFTLATIFLIIPFHFVVVVERELRHGQQERILRLLTGSERSVVPKGTLYIKPPLLGLLLVVAAICFLIVRTYLLHQIQPASFMNLLMALYYVRLLLLVGLPAYCLVWYYQTLNELKRHCVENSRLVTDAV